MREIASCRIEGYASTAFISRSDPYGAPGPGSGGVRDEDGKSGNVGKNGKALCDLTVFAALTVLPTS
jgi:hypothetical protein